MLVLKGLPFSNLWKSLWLKRELPKEFHPLKMELPKEFHPFNMEIPKEFLDISVEVSSKGLPL